MHFNKKIKIKIIEILFFGSALAINIYGEIKNNYYFYHRISFTLYLIGILIALIELYEHLKE